MYEFIRGTVDEITPVYAVLETGGIGYFIRISLHTYEQIQGTNPVRLFVEYIVREDGHFLYGFATKQEREFFRHLTSISGIGAASALSILSAFPPEELARLIVDENVGMLKTVKGIGPKTAKRIIVELKDKLLKDPAVWEGTAPSVAGHQQAAEAVAALEVLGYPRRLTEKIVAALVKEFPDEDVEQIIKLALKRL